MTLGNDEKDDEDLYTMDDKSDGEGMSMPMVIVEEEPGTVSMTPAKEPTLRNKNLLRTHTDLDLEEGSDDDKADDDIGWDDAYEQEV